MSETFGLRLTCAQRLVASDLLPELADRLMLDTRNERTIPLTQKQIERLRDAASKAIGDAPTGTVRNSLRHIVDKSSDLLTRESAAKEVMQLKVTLVGSDPPIWRRIETHDCSLATLHDIIQVAMGWENCSFRLEPSTLRETSAVAPPAGCSATEVSHDGAKSLDRVGPVCSGLPGSGWVRSGGDNAGD
jgi:hypothetical protein